MSMRIASATNKHSCSGPHAQRGAIGMWGSLTLLLAVMFMALAVDTGRLWMQQRKLQSIADIASMEAARQIGCETDMAEVVAAAQTAAARNGFSGQLSAAPNLVQLGSVSTTGGIRQFTDDSDEEAVRVYATQSVPASLVAGGLFGNQVVLNAEAVSAGDPTLVAFSAGSFLLSVSDENADLMNLLLGDLLGTNVNLTAASYESLASANLTLANLVRVQGAASVEDLLEAELSMGELMDLINEGVADAGTAGTVASNALEALSTGITNNGSIKLSDIVTVSSPNEDSTASLDLNAFSLITAAALFTNESSTVSLEIAGITANITITQAPTLAVGPSQGSNCTIARTAQLVLGVSASASIPLVGSVDLALNATVAQGTAELTEFSDNGSESHIVIEATPGIASVNGSTTLVVEPPLMAAVSVPVSISLPLGASVAQELEFDVPHPTADNLPQMQTVASPLGDSLENALQQEDILTIPALGPLVEPLVEEVINDLLAPLLGQIGRILLDPLLEMLGIRLGGMDVTLYDIQLRQEKPLII